MTEKELVTVLNSTGLPARYAFFSEPQSPPYLVYMGDGQDIFHADDSTFYKNNTYRVEYYYTKKDPAVEEAIEKAFLDAGLRYDKSEDVYISDERVFMIYYYVN